MAADPRLNDPGFCGCNAADVPQAPAAIWNRPSLPEIAWRSGTFAGFRAAALRDLTIALPGLSTREADDHAVTLIELWAAMADVLTFYHERIANEAYLRTAVSRDSVRRLARLLDYTPFAGLAAETRVAFTLEQGTSVALRPGLRLMSVPGQDEVPQIFELIEEVAAEARLNRVPVRGMPFAYDPFAAGARAATIPVAPEKLSPGDAVMAFWAGRLEEKTLERVSGVGDARTFAWAPPMQAPMPAPAQFAKVERALRLFGHNQPATRMVFDPGAKTGNSWTRSPGWTSEAEVLSLPAGDTAYPLDGRIEGIKPGAAVIARSEGGAVRAAVVTSVSETTEAFGGVTDTVTTLRIARTMLGSPALTMAPSGIVRAMFRATTGEPLLSSSAMPTIADDVWSEPGVLPRIGAIPAPMTGDLQVAASGTRTDVLARGEGGLLHLRALGATLLPWATLDAGASVDDPAVVAPADDLLRLFARGAGNTLLMRTATGTATPAWSAWEDLGGVMTGPAAAACIPADATVPAAVAGMSCAVARGADGSIWSIFIARDGTRSPWRRLAEAEMAAEVSIATAGQVFAVLARAQSAPAQSGGALRLAVGVPGTWSGWITLPGSEGAVGRPAMSLGAGSFAFAWRDGEGTIRLLPLAFGAAAAPVELGGPCGGDPVLAGSSGRLLLAARFSDGTLRARSRIAGTWRGWVTLAPGLGPITDRRAVRLWQVAQPFIAARRHDYPARIAASRITVPLPLLDRIEKGRSVVLSDGATTHAATVTGSAPIPATPGNPHALLAIDITPPLPRPLESATAVMQGNVARAGQGETQAEEILGDGDAARAFQRFALRKAPITRRTDAASLRGKPELTVLVDGQAWDRADSLHGHRPDERIYAIEEAEGGKSVIRFGDGVNGARLPTGRGNVRVRYRTGLGRGGNVRTEQLSILLTRPAGLRDGRNPLPAEGGAEPESADDVRAAAPGKVRSFGRAVSLDDLAILAVETGLAGKARADWVWSGIERAVHLSVAGPGGTTLSHDALGKLGSVLDTVRDITQRLILGAALPVAVRLSGTVFVADGFVRAEVEAAVRAALRERFSFTRVGFAEPVHRSDIDLAIQAVPGVAGIDLDTLGFRSMSEFTAEGRKARDLAPGVIQPHLRLFPARPATSAVADPVVAAAYGGVRPRILPAEQAMTEDGDIILTVTGGIA